MKESATTALTYLQSNAKKYGFDTDIFAKKTLHIHVPEGGTPKDGPSAGITMMTFPGFCDYRQKSKTLSGNDR